MPYTFSTMINNTNIRIRVAPNLLHQETLLDERPHKHFFVEFHYVYQGEEIICCPQQEKTFSLAAGDIIMIPREIYHYVKTREGQHVTRLCFNFCIDDEENKENPLFLISQNIKEIAVFRESFISNAMERYREIMADEQDPMQETREGLLLLDIILELFRRLSDGIKPSSKSQEKFRQKGLIEEYIWTRYYAPEGLAGLASILYLSERQTRKLIKQFYGEDYKTLIVRQRMETAQLLLQSNDFSLDEIAEKVGYRSYSGFHLAFVQFFGMTPGDYRKNLK